jgi:hypothetical protein
MFYILGSVIEVALLIGIVALAWTWPCDQAGAKPEA